MTLLPFRLIARRLYTSPIMSMHPVPFLMPSNMKAGMYFTYLKTLKITPASSITVEYSETDASPSFPNYSIELATIGNRRPVNVLKRIRPAE